MSRQGSPGVTHGAAARAILLIAAATAMATFAVAQNSRDEQQRLQAVRKEIKAIEQKLARQTTERDDSARALRAAETDIAAATRKLAAVRTDLRAQEREQRTLADQTSRASARLGAERAELGRQVRAAYMSGREEVLELLLSQDSPATLGRMLVYYDYFNRARGVRIAAINGEVEKLDGLRADGDRLRGELAALEAAQAAEVASLERSRDERRALLAKLEVGIGDTSSAISKLRTEEKRLGDLVKQIAQATAGFPVDTGQPFARLKGKLAWPVRGRITGDYGQPRAGGPVKWNGVLLEASQGTPVRAVYHGRVAFADWLPGLGLLIIVDHGGGYLSLYAHNEALLKESGDSVATGEAIAQVGDSGGQARPGLYFEIRQNGEPVNPHAWVAPSASSR